MSEEDLDTKVEVTPRELYKLADMCYHFVSKSKHES